MKRILLLGGTGAMGKYLSRILLQNGENVFITSRKEHPSTKKCTYILGNAQDTRFLKQIIAEVKPDAIVDFMVYSTAEFCSRAEFLLQHTGHYIFLSSARVFNEDEVITEKTPRLLDSIVDNEYLRTDEYALAKARQENFLTASKYNNWTIVRPTITYSTGRFQFGCLEADSIIWRSQNHLPVPMPKEMLEKITTMTWAGDVAKLISLLLFKPEAVSDDFNLVTTEYHTWQEVGSIYKQNIGMNTVEVPLSDYASLFISPYQMKYSRMFNRHYDNSKILSCTGFRQHDFTQLADGLKRELDSFAKENNDLNVNIPLNAHLDRIMGIRMPVSCIPKGKRLLYIRGRYQRLNKYCSLLSRIKRFF